MPTFEGTGGTYADTINLFATGIQFIRDFIVDRIHAHGCKATGGVEITISSGSSLLACAKGSGTWDIAGSAPSTPLTLDAVSNYFTDSLTQITKTLAHDETA